MLSSPTIFETSSSPCWFVGATIAKEDLHEIFIQGHEMRFSTVDLTQSHEVIKNRLLNLVS